MNREELKRKLDVDGNGKVNFEDVVALSGGSDGKLFSIGMAVATLSLGLPLWKLYKYAQMILAAPFP